ncbi:hypothetical protein N0V84_000441 [Fusarium piperis]|uniref:CBM-cenC domain-containing protein n=1 Tax=Fusarium piperis TaxID=1435070 RepID=A0A9W8WNF2_9HYPO|nr:hypothetical protein N0V84_000441 [Fusarium piperis]
MALGRQPHVNGAAEASAPPPSDQNDKLLLIAPGVTRPQALLSPTVSAASTESSAVSATESATSSALSTASTESTTASASESVTTSATLSSAFTKSTDSTTVEPTTATTSSALSTASTESNTGFTTTEFSITSADQSTTTSMSLSHRIPTSSNPGSLDISTDQFYTGQQSGSYEHHENYEDERWGIYQTLDKTRLVVEERYLVTLRIRVPTADCPDISVAISMGNGGIVTQGQSFINVGNAVNNWHEARAMFRYTQPMINNMPGVAIISQCRDVSFWVDEASMVKYVEPTTD